MYFFGNWEILHRLHFPFSSIYPPACLPAYQPNSISMPPILQGASGWITTVNCLWTALITKPLSKVQDEFTPSLLPHLTLFHVLTLIFWIRFPGPQKFLISETEVQSFFLITTEFAQSHAY